MIYTTFKLCKEARACVASSRKFRKFKGGAEWPMDKPFPLTEVLEVLGLDDALWCLRCTTDQIAAGKFSRLLACDHAERVLPLYEKQFPGDSRVRDCIVMARDFANGRATREQLNAAWVAVRAAAEDAAWAAESAAWAAESAARAAARDAAESAARAAARAAESAARAAARAAESAAWAAGVAARAAERQWQTAHLKEMLEGEA